FDFLSATLWKFPRTRGTVCAAAPQPQDRLSPQFYPFPSHRSGLPVGQLAFSIKEKIVMTDLMLMRQTPVSLLRDWLTKNTESLRMIPERDIILQARLAVPEISQMDNGDIAWEIHQWAKTHSFLPVDLPGVPIPGSSGATPVRAGDPEIIDRLKSLLKTLQ